MHRLVAGMRGTASQLIGALFELFATTHVGAYGSEPAMESRTGRQPSLHEIVSVVAKYYGLAQKHLKSGCRKQSTVIARATATYLARELTDASYGEIGRALGGRDHTTMMHNFRKIDREQHNDPVTQQAIDDLRRILSCY
jgi:chromosomal replication initiator protein